MKRFLAPILLLAAVWLGGCSDPTVPYSQDFTTATMWVYHVDSLALDGSVITSRNDTVRVLSIDRSCAFKTITFSDNSVATMVNDGPGFALMYFNVDPTLCRVNFPVPAHRGDTLMSLEIGPASAHGVAGSGRLNFYVKATDISVGVAAGIFRCDEMGMSEDVIPFGSRDFFVADINEQLGLVRKLFYLQDVSSQMMYLCKRVELLSTK